MPNLSNFPASIDSFIQHYEISASQISSVVRFQELKLKSSRTSAEETELGNLTTQLRSYLISADDFNKFQDALVNMETFIKDGVEGYILTKQSEYNTSLSTATSTIQTQKDAALGAIENKKDNIIAYMDSTTAGSIRNDIGIMGNLQTSDKDSLVDAINEVDTALITHSTNSSHVFYAVDSGTANAKVVYLSSTPTAYFDGLAISFKNSVASTGAVTINVNGLGAKTIVKSNGNALSSGNLKAASIYTIRYNSTTSNFILQGEGGEYGTAAAAQVLTGYNIGTDSGLVDGTIVNNGAGGTVTPSSSTQTKPAGYYSSSITISGVTVPAANVLTGTTIAGTAGTMPNNGTINRTPSNVSQSIPAGYTTGGTVSAVTVNPATVLAGTTIAGTAGNIPIKLPDYTDQLLATNTSYGNWSGDGTPYIYLAITPNQYYSGVSWIRKYEPTIVPSNFRSGYTAFGGQLVGTLVEGKPYATGTYSNASGWSSFSSPALAFTPNRIIIRSNPTFNGNQYAKEVVYSTVANTLLNSYIDVIGATAVSPTWTITAGGFTINFNEGQQTNTIYTWEAWSV